MKKFITTWFNYIAQGETTERIKANSWEDAIQLTLRIMRANHPSMHYDEDDVSTVSEVTDNDYMGEEEVTKYETQMKAYYSK